MLPFIQECYRDGDSERHTRPGAKIHVVLRGWNKSEGGNECQFDFFFKACMQQNIILSVSVKLRKA